MRRIFPFAPFTFFARNNFWNFRTIRRCFGFDEFNLAVRVAEFGELGLEQRVVARVVHEAEVILKFRVKADD